MEYNPYEILGLATSASLSEIEERYKELKEKYQKDRFAVGQVGEDAAENLERLEVAYRDIMSEKEHQDDAESFGGSGYGRIQENIKNGKLDEAQKMLDDVSIRDGEWHYLQSIIFYKRNWFLESKKQLEFACSMEPQNTRYSDSLAKLTKILASNTISPDQLRTTEAPQYQQQMGAGNGTCTGSVCTDCIMCNLCCNCCQCMACR